MTRLRTPLTYEDHVAGPPDAPLTLLEYGDYECPSCGAAYPAIQRVRAVLGDRLRFAFRNFPLAEVHPHAMLAAEAAESAGVDGRFWEMHGTLFQNQDALDAGSIGTYADALGLDLERFADDLATHRFEPKIRRDFLNGARTGVNGTPTFFINGFHYRGAYDARSLLSALTYSAGLGAVPDVALKD